MNGPAAYISHNMLFGDLSNNILTSHHCEQNSFRTFQNNSSEGIHDISLYPDIDACVVLLYLQEDIRNKNVACNQHTKPWNLEKTLPLYMCHKKDCVCPMAQPSKKIM
jgi:hypothetical protein